MKKYIYSYILLLSYLTICAKHLSGRKYDFFFLWTSIIYLRRQSCFCIFSHYIILMLMRFIACLSDVHIYGYIYFFYQWLHFRSGNQGNICVYISSKNKTKLNEKWETEYTIQVTYVVYCYASHTQQICIVLSFWPPYCFTSRWGLLTQGQCPVHHTLDTTAG